MEGITIEHHLRELQEARLPTRETVINIVSVVEKILLEEPNIINISGKVTVVGDLHGQFFDFLHILELANYSQAADEAQMLFLGDYVDRGYNSVELILYLFLMKMKNPQRVFLLRGNHENRAQTSAYGFATECIAKYDYYVYWRICDSFELLPMAAMINDTYFCIHGGPTPGLSLRKIAESDRTEEFSSLGPIMWGDPSEEIEWFQESQRGAGFLFGSAALASFLEDTSCKYLVRSHQLVFDGILESFEGRCITVWSAPNYCYKCKNLAAIMIIDGSTHTYVFFDAVPLQYIA